MLCVAVPAREIFRKYYCILDRNTSALQSHPSNIRTSANLYIRIIPPALSVWLVRRPSPPPPVDNGAKLGWY